MADHPRYLDHKPLEPYPPIIFFGSDNFSLPSLQALHETGWQIKAVITKPDSPSGRGRQLTSPPTKTWAEQHDIPVLQPENLRDTEPKLSQYSVQLGVVASYGKIIPDSVLGLFSLGLVNVHPSHLPKYRGASPIEAAILNGDATTGVTLIKLTSEMDAGPRYVYASGGGSPRLLNQSELYDNLAKLGAEELVHHLPYISAGRLLPKPQRGNPTYTHLISKSDGQIDWSRPAEQIERQIRAYLTWPGSRTNLFGKDVIITVAHVEVEGEACPPGKCLHISTGQGCLVIDKLKPAGGREMTAAEFLAGIRN
jgi:methionyl-tRNA formyltransferase